MKRKIFLLIDPQNDFVEGGSLAVRGGKVALENTAKHLEKHGDEYDIILVSLDTHNPTNLGFPGNWTGPAAKELIPGYPFPVDLIGPELRPRNYYTAGDDIEMIKKQPGFMCWPPHCIKDTPGWLIYEPLEKVLLGLGKKVIFKTKGEDDARDNYSLFHYGDRGLTKLAQNFNLWDLKYDDPEIYVAGLAMDFCVFETVKSLQEICKNGSYNIMINMTASIQESEVVSDLYKTGLKKKVNIVI
jgi:nicotinamidase/pyrazinamidase